MLSVLFKQLILGIPFIKKHERCKKKPPNVQKRVLFIRGLLNYTQISLYSSCQKATY